jgi:hypothetical protein
LASLLNPIQFSIVPDPVHSFGRDMVLLGNKQDLRRIVKAL